jgi:hypothetical protein
MFFSVWKTIAKYHMLDGLHKTNLLSPRNPRPMCDQSLFQGDQTP